jgi:hypothetical protein
VQGALLGTKVSDQVSKDFFERLTGNHHEDGDEDHDKDDDKRSE